MTIGVESVSQDKDFEPEKEFVVASDNIDEIMGKLSQGLPSEEIGEKNFLHLLDNKDTDFTAAGMEDEILSVQSHQQLSSDAPIWEELESDDDVDVDVDHDTIFSEESLLDDEPEKQQDAESSSNSNIDRLLRDSNEANGVLLESIANAKRKKDSFVKERARVWEIIQRKQKALVKIKRELSTMDNTTSLLSEEDGINKEISAHSKLAGTVNCQGIIDAAKNTQEKINGNHVSSWNDGLSCIKNEVKILEIRLQYIEQLKDIDGDYLAYKRLLKEERDSEVRFQNYRAFFE